MFFTLVCVAWLALDIALVAAVFGAVKLYRYFYPVARPMAVYIDPPYVGHPSIGAAPRTGWGYPCDGCDYCQTGPASDPWLQAGRFP
jgi:hypothetical protein